MRIKLLKWWASITLRQPYLILGAVVLVTATFAMLAGRLRLEMHFKNLMPAGHPMVQEFNRILEEYQTASMIIVAVRGEEAAIKQFAEALAPRLRMQKRFIRRVDYKLELEFYRQHGFMLQKKKDLENSVNLFSDLNLLPWLTQLNENFEKTYVYDENSLATREREDEAIAALDGIAFWLSALKRTVAATDAVGPALARKAATRMLLGDPYIISADKRMLLLFAQPTFTIMDIDIVVQAADTLDAIIAEMAKDYPGVDAGLTGAIALARDEMAAINRDMYLTSLIAFVLIIALFIVAFRMWGAPLLAGVCLLVGIIWTAGSTQLMIGNLNLMTSMFSVILVGLGIDFAIHLISVFTEARAAGQDIHTALQTGLLKSGGGIITGALTTACAFLTLLISDSAGMEEFGLVAGTGVLLTMLATLITLPSLLVLRERILARRRSDCRILPVPRFVLLGKMAGCISRSAHLAMTAAVILSLLAIWAASQMTFDYNYLNMEPIGLKSIELQHVMEAAFDATPDFALVTTHSVEASRRITEAARELKMIGFVTSISDYVPSTREQEERRPLVETIRKRLVEGPAIHAFQAQQLDAFVTELQRLEDNIIELAQLAYLGGQAKVDAKCQEIVGDIEDRRRHSSIMALIDSIRAAPASAVQRLSRFHRAFTEALRELVYSMASPESITLASLPVSIRDRFVNARGDHMLVTIYPKQQVWDLEFLERFFAAMQQIDPRVTGVPLIFYVLMDIVARDGRLAAGLSLAVIFLLLLLDLRRFSWALYALLPLLAGAIWMVGAMKLAGLQFTLLNVLGLPLILGIGIDDGVHILHRYRLEGAGNLKEIFTSTGKAVLLTSLTTMLAFGSLVFATYRGLGSLGSALFIGVGTCFLATIILLPAILAIDRQA